MVNFIPNEVCIDVRCAFYIELNIIWLMSYSSWKCVIPSNSQMFLTMTYASEMS